MRTWCTSLTLGLGILLGAMVMQDFEIRRLSKEQIEDRKLMNEACGTFLDAAKQYNKGRREDDQFRVLLLKHNDLLIQNLGNGKLEKPSAPPIIQALPVKEKDP